ncbi:MAG: exodeoxyribonuclease VII small subunit [Bacteroidetes bacterium]|nr:exodeoxyribonuclease VII small subunit [Bacteroidota bacterium]
MIEPKAASPSSIEAKMNQIRTLMARLQQEEGSLDESLGLYYEATNLITQCQQMLDEVADRINNPSSSQP